MSIASEWGYPESSQGLTFEQCVPYMCGQPGPQASINACAVAGYTGNFSCAESPCTETGNGCTLVSASAPITPAQIGTQSAPRSRGKRSGLTPQNLVPIFPDITARLAPVPAACSSWDNLNAAIEQNPVIAVAVLAGLYFLLRKKGR